MAVELNDDDLITAAQSGDAVAQTNLYQRYVRLLYGYLYRTLGSRVLADDLCQETFLRALKGLPRYRRQASFKNWLFQIAKNVLADHWRKHYTTSAVALDDYIAFHHQPVLPAADDVAKEQSTKADQLHNILQQLPPDYRLVLEYRFLRCYSLAETAEALGISLSNAKIRQFRALQKARNLANNLHV